MTPEAQRIAIAEACGWTNVHRFDKWKEGGTASHHDGDLVGDFEGRTCRHLPNYLNSLDAMHEAELELNTPKNMQRHAWNNYRARLDKVTAGSAFHATAPQRAEAYLRTLNLWIDDHDA